MSSEREFLATLRQAASEVARRLVKLSRRPSSCPFPYHICLYSWLTLPSRLLRSARYRSPRAATSQTAQAGATKKKVAPPGGMLNLQSRGEPEFIFASRLAQRIGAERFMQRANEWERNREELGDEKP